MLDPGQLHLIELLLSIAGFLILFLLGIIGFWIQKWIRATDALTEAITNLKVLFAGTQATIANLENNCEACRKITAERLNNHSAFIHEHSTQLKILESKTKP
jgi:hypothetical protein